MYSFEEIFVILSLFILSLIIFVLEIGLIIYFVKLFWNLF